MEEEAQSNDKSQISIEEARYDLRRNSGGSARTAKSMPRKTGPIQQGIQMRIPWSGAASAVRQRFSEADNNIKSAFTSLASDLKTQLSRSEEALKRQGVNMQKLYEWASCVQSCGTRLVSSKSQALLGKIQLVFHRDSFSSMPRKLCKLCSLAFCARING